jgi:hypothetical protein
MAHPGNPVGATSRFCQRPWARSNLAKLPCQGMAIGQADTAAGIADLAAAAAGIADLATAAVDTAD